MSKRLAKKEWLLERGLEVMQHSGYNGTSVKDIVDAAQVPKGSFYTYFESKEHFAIEAITMAADQYYQEAKQLLENNQLSALARLEAYFRHGAEHACSNDYQVGCFVGNMCQEMADNNEEIRKLTQSMMQRHTRLIAHAIDSDNSLHGTQTLPTLVLAEFIYNAWQGALLKMKSAKSEQPLAAFMSVLPHIVNA